MYEREREKRETVRKREREREERGWEGGSRRKGKILMEKTVLTVLRFVGAVWSKGYFLGTQEKSSSGKINCSSLLAFFAGNLVGRGNFCERFTKDFFSSGCWNIIQRRAGKVFSVEIWSVRVQGRCSSNFRGIIRKINYCSQVSGVFKLKVTKIEIDVN